MEIALILTQNWIRLSPIRKFIGPSYDLRKKLDETLSSPIFFQIIARTNKFAYWTKKESNFFIVMYVDISNFILYKCFVTYNYNNLLNVGNIIKNIIKFKLFNHNILFINILMHVDI